MVNHYEFVKDNPQVFKQFSCKELLFLIIDCPPEFTQSEDLVEHNCFIYVITGNHMLFSREKSWIISTGQTAFIKKGGLGIKKIDDELFCALMFYVPDSYLRSFIHEKTGIISKIDPVETSHHLILSVAHDQILAAFYDSVLSYFAAGKQPPEDLVELKFRELLLNIIINPANKELTCYLYKLFIDRADELQDIMERNFVYDLQLEEYARLCHRSLASFKRDFYKTYKMPPGRWLLAKRLEAAKHLLCSPEKSVHDVAFESGFRNDTHFSRLFKSFYGSSPLQFRKGQLSHT
ncbi:MAG TPA: AraC family transcriptional regulator [Chitinophagaceae bacterium]|jgi:AraC family transcriptional regulator, exoenzyme S synthesis regulatory protein ExsA|nr:AraC family transcriptional regulator [Chitinophagaceae bacterium]